MDDPSVLVYVMGRDAVIIPKGVRIRDIPNVSTCAGFSCVCTCGTLVKIVLHTSEIPFPVFLDHVQQNVAEIVTFVMQETRVYQYTCGKIHSDFIALLVDPHAARLTAPLRPRWPLLLTRLIVSRSLLERGLLLLEARAMVLRAEDGDDDDVGRDDADEDALNGGIVRNLLQLPVLGDSCAKVLAAGGFNLRRGGRDHVADLIGDAGEGRAEGRGRDLGEEDGDDTPRTLDAELNAES
jgi:hypothetical protein